MIQYKKIMTFLVKECEYFLKNENLCKIKISSKKIGFDLISVVIFFY